MSICSVCGNLTEDGCPNCYVCDIVQCRRCSSEFHYHCITEWAICNGQRVCPDRRIKTHFFDFQRQTSGDGILSCFIASPTPPPPLDSMLRPRKKRLRKDNAGSSPPPPHPSATFPGPKKRCSICGNLTEDGCPSCYLCDTVQCCRCFSEFHYHCITDWVMKNNGKRVCPNPNRQIKTHKFEFQQQAPGASFRSFFIAPPPPPPLHDPKLMPRKKWSRNDSAGSSPPKKSSRPPPPPANIPRPRGPRCSICGNFIEDGCPSCYQCDAVQCRRCFSEFHYDCITNWVISNKGKRSCPNPNHQTHTFDFQRQAPGATIRSFFIAPPPLPQPPPPLPQPPPPPLDPMLMPMKKRPQKDSAGSSPPKKSSRPPPPANIPRPPQRCSICGNLTEDGCPSCYRCDVVQCRRCFSKFHYHCITEHWVRCNNGKRVCPNPNRRIEIHKFDIQRQAPRASMLSFSIAPPPPSPPPPPAPLDPMLLPRKKRPWNDIAAGSCSPKKLRLRKIRNCQDGADSPSPAPIVLHRKRWKCKVSTDAPFPSPPALEPARPPICEYDIVDICRHCIASVEANDQHEVVCHAVECRRCTHVFHHHCITHWFISHQGIRDCPIQFINHRFRFRRQRPGNDIQAYYI